MSEVPKSGSPQLQSPARWLVIVTFGAVVSFLGANFYSQRSAARIDAEALGIATSAAPGIARLAQVWREIHRLDASTSPALVRSAGANRIDRTSFNRSRSFLHEANQDGLLPAVPGQEQELRDEVRASLSALLAAADAGVEAVDAGDLDRARQVRLRQGHPAAARADAAVANLVAFEAARARDAGDRIRAYRLHATRISYVLDAVSVALALALLVLATRAARLHARAIDERNRLAEERASELEQFAERVAHDLKGPLGALVFRLTLAQPALHLDERSGPFFANLLDAVWRMNRLIDSLLQFATSGGRPEPGASAQVDEVVAGVVADVRADAAKSGAELAVDPFAPASVACAPGALGSVLENLVRNAAKYIVEAPRQDRRIVVRVREGDTMVRIEVEDNGPGIPAGQERAVFERHVRAQNTSQPGLGLGLATVKRIVDAHGGSVGVESKLGSGARFWFELPKLAPARRAPITMHASAGVRR